MVRVVLNGDILCQAPGQPCAEPLRHRSTCGGGPEHGSTPGAGRRPQTRLSGRFLWTLARFCAALAGGHRACLPQNVARNPGMPWRALHGLERGPSHSSLGHTHVCQLLDDFHEGQAEFPEVSMAARRGVAWRARGSPWRFAKGPLQVLPSGHRPDVRGQDLES